MYLYYYKILTRIYRHLSIYLHEKNMLGKCRRGEAVSDMEGRVLHRGT